MKLIYPARIYPEDNGQYTVCFPDLNNAATYGNNLEDALDMAVDLLGSWLLDHIENGNEIPKASHIKDISLEGENNFKTLVVIDLTEYERLHGKKFIKKTLTLPAWLNTIAEKNNINFSTLLQQAIMKHLDL